MCCRCQAVGVILFVVDALFGKNCQRTYTHCFDTEADKQAPGLPNFATTFTIVVAEYWSS